MHTYVCTYILLLHHPFALILAPFPQGDGLKGYDILLHYHRASTTASKELMDYLKDRAAVEEAYVKSLQRMHKTLLQVTEPAVG